MYLVERAGRRFGPLSAEQLRQYAKAGKLRASDLIVQKDGNSLGSVSAIPRLRELLPANEQGINPTPPLLSTTLTAAPAPSQTEDRASRSARAHSVLKQIWSGGKPAAAIGSLAGFIGDFLEPLAPINGFLFLGALATSIVLGTYLALKPTRWGDLDRRFPQECFIFSSFLLVAFGGWFLVHRLHPDQDRGVLASHFTLVARAQDQLLQLNRDVAAIKQDTTAIRDMLSAIGNQRGLVTRPTTSADHYHNAMLHLRNGNPSAAEESFKEFIGLDSGTSFDAYAQYAGLVLGKYAPARGKRLLESLAQAFPTNLSARLIRITETVEDDREARQQLAEMVAAHPDFLPSFLCLQDRLPGGLLIDDLDRDKLRTEFKAAGGADAFKTFVLNPAEGEGKDLVARAVAFEQEEPVDPMRRLWHGLRADPDITLLWLGVSDSRPGRQLILSFPGGVDVQLPLDSPDNPAALTGTPGVPIGVVPGTCVALELPRDGNVRRAAQPAFNPRKNNDVRRFPHAGELAGVPVDPTLAVQVAYVDAAGRTFRFPKPLKLFGQEDGGGGMFTVEINRRDSFDPTPVLQITSAIPMSRLEAAGRAEGPFVAVPAHMNVPTMNEIACAAVPFFTATRGSTQLWVRGTTTEGEGVSATAVDVGVPPVVRWKTFEPVAARQARADAGVTALKFEPPNSYSDFYIDRLAFSPDGKRLAAMMERAGLVVWDIESGRQTHLVEADTGKTLAFSADGARLTNGLVVVDLATSDVSPCLTRSADTFGAAVSASLAVAATIDRAKQLVIYDFPAGTQSAAVKLEHEQGFPAVVAISPDATLVGVAGRHVDVVWLVERATGAIKKKLEAPGTGVTGLAFSPDGKQLLAVGPESCVRIWNLTTDEDSAARLSFDDNSPEAIWTMKGIPLVADIGPTGLTLTNARTGDSVAQIDGSVKRFAVSPSGTAIAIAQKTSVVVRPVD